jgi:hypothetical protein
MALASGARPSTRSRVRAIIKFADGTLPTPSHLAAERDSLSQMADALSPTMTLREFENGYWYLDQLKQFAKRIGIPAAHRLRKDELEKAIVAFLRTGDAALPTTRALRKTGVKDVERGLTLTRRIEHYTSNPDTKDFIVQQARVMAPEVRETSSFRSLSWRASFSADGNSRDPGFYAVMTAHMVTPRLDHGLFLVYRLGRIVACVTWPSLFSIC